VVYVPDFEGKLVSDNERERELEGDNETVNDGEHDEHVMEGLCEYERVSLEENEKERDDEYVGDVSVNEKEYDNETVAV
jgi:hypothetical protein